MSRYAVHEVFHSLQGEGTYAGRSAVFVRFAGCNLWSGREEDRAKGHGSCAAWCDTTFVGTEGSGGGRFDGAEPLAEHVGRFVPAGTARGHLVVCTGGEPLLQLDAPLVAALRSRGYEVAIETNGTRPMIEGGVDWVCMSPKGGTTLALERCDELKLVYPHEGLGPERFAGFPARVRYLQPLHDANHQRHLEMTVEYCLQHPEWRVSLQLHKLLGLP